MKIEVQCEVCGKKEFVFLSRVKKYKTCSKKCLGKYHLADNNAKCCVCGKEFHVKPKRLQRIKNEYGITCSLVCSKKIKEKMYMGRNNPNSKYNLDDNFFKEVNNEEKAYLLGWIASDGSITPSTITIAIHKKDVKCLEILRDIICSELPITDKIETIKTFSINSKTISNDVCKLLNIKPEKKSHIVCFPDLENDELKWVFLRGLFDGDGSIRNIDDEHCNPECNITSSSIEMRKAIIDFCKIPCSENGINLNWYGNNALDFLNKLYNSQSKYRLIRKYEIYLDISTWMPSVSYSRHYKNEHCQWSKTRKDAISPSKTRASDSGYDLVLLEKIKTVGKVEFYDTGIKVKPKFGYYFELVPRSSISKTGYMLANSIGIIDRTYLGNIMVALIKIDESAPDLVLPMKLVQIIPKHIVHFEWDEVDSFDVNETERGEGGFGSTNKNK